VTRWRLCAAGAGRECAPAALFRASGRPLSFTLRRLVLARALVMLLIAPLVVTGCASLRNQPDGMCAEIARFANSTGDASAHKVELVNDWGGPISQQESQKGDFTLYVKRCDHGGYDPAKVLCAYLMEHTSTEFPYNTVRRALLCLNDPATSPYTARGAAYSAVTASSRSALYVHPHMQVGLEYSEEREALIISAQQVK
jgi:hypothetical protein